MWGPPYGEVRDATVPVRAAAASTPVEWLLARGLLLPAGQQNVALPREAALTLRGGRAHRTPAPLPPAVDGCGAHRAHRGHDGGRPGADRRAHRRRDARPRGRPAAPPCCGPAGSACGTSSGSRPPWTCPSRRPPSGSNSLTRQGWWPPTANWTRRTRPRPPPTAGCSCPPPSSGRLLAAAWLRGHPHARPGRQPGPEGPRAVARSAPTWTARWRRTSARRVLDLLAGLPPGSRARPRRAAGPAALGPPAAAGRGRPARGRAAVDPARRGGPRRHRPGRAGRARPPAAGLRRDRADPDAAAAALAPLLPEPLDHVLLQADLTAVAPGPARRAARRDPRGARRHRVQGRRDGLPLHARVGAAGAGRGAYGGRAAGVPDRALAHARAAAAQLSHRRRGPPARHAAGRRRVRVPALRRRRAAHRTPRRPPGERPRAAPARPDRAGRPERPRDAARTAARDGPGAGRGVRRRRRR